MPGSFENYLLNSNNWRLMWIYFHKSVGASGDKWTEVLRGPSSEFYCNKAGLTSRSRVSVCCGQCRNMSFKNSPASQGWASCGGCSVMATAASHQVNHFACEMQIFNISINYSVFSKGELWIWWILDPHMVKGCLYPDSFTRHASR